MRGLVSTLRGDELGGTSCALNSSSIFYDIGSGLGRLALYVRLTTGVAQVRGVELNACRHARAERMAVELELAPRQLAFYHGDAAVSEHGANASHWFVSPICFADDTLAALAARAREPGGPRCVVSFGRELPARWLPPGMGPLLAESLPATFQSSAIVTYYGTRDAAV